MVRSTTMAESHDLGEDLAAFEAAAVEIVTRASVVLRERFTAGVSNADLQFKDKQQRDPVTAIDRAVEELVRSELTRRFPSHGILGEEGTGRAIESELLWVLDPIDGTANFAGKLPFYGLSLALLRGGRPIVGCVYVPFWPGPAGGVLSAVLGRGARVGDQPVKLEQQTFRPSGPVAVPPGLRGMFELRGDVRKRPGEARNLGSIVAEIAMVAAGGFQYAVFAAPKLWDVAAGALIVREAGGVALTWERGAWRRLDQFKVPPPPPSKPPKPGEKPKPPPTLRDWVQPVLVASPAAARHVGSGLRPRGMPGPVLRWLLKQRKSAREWWTKRRQLPKPTPPEPGTQSPKVAAAGQPP